MYNLGKSECPKCHKMEFSINTFHQNKETRVSEAGCDACGYHHTGEFICLDHAAERHVKIDTSLIAEYPADVLICVVCGEKGFPIVA